MTAWEILKTKMTEEKRHGSFGYHIEVNRAVDIFTGIIPYLKDEKGEKDAFNADPDVAPALQSRGLSNTLKDLGVL